MDRPQLTAPPQQPADIAREALRRLAQARVPPTPENYSAAYHEVAGTAPLEAFPDRLLRGFVASLPRSTQGELAVVRELELAASEGTWSAWRGALAGLARRAGREAQDWSSLLRGLLQQAEISRTDSAGAKRREDLGRLLASAQGDPDQLFRRLYYLLQKTGSPAQDGAPPEAAAAPDAPAPAAAPAAQSELTEAAARPLPILLEMLAHIIERACIPVTGADGRLTDQGRTLAQDIRAAQGADNLQELIPRLTRFAARLEWSAQDQAEIRNTFISVLRLIVENIGEVVGDDNWLGAQLEVLNDLLWQPMELRRVESVEYRLREVAEAQGALREKLRAAKDHARAVLTHFMDHLSGFADTTRDYRDKVGDFKARVATADSLAQLADVIEDVIRETEAIEARAESSHELLNAMKARAAEAEQEINRLQSELVQTTQLLRQDPLTGMLNRKGLEEALAREVPRARRRGAPLCVAALDIDNFTRLNDTFGHEAGDSALVHLSQVMRENLRPQDTLSRYGGEEFVILLPETELHDAVKVLMRLQRELTKRFFLSDNKRVLVTFSAGATRLKGEEEPEATLERSEQAMRQAKEQGKNQVVALS